MFLTLCNIPVLFLYSPSPGVLKLGFQTEHSCVRPKCSVLGAPCVVVAYSACRSNAANPYSIEVCTLCKIFSSMGPIASDLLHQLGLFLGVGLAFVRCRHFSNCLYAVSVACHVQRKTAPGVLFIRLLDRAADHASGICRLFES